MRRWQNSVVAALVVGAAMVVGEPVAAGPACSVVDQLTDEGPSMVFNGLVADGSGTRLAFTSDANPLGTNVDGNVELFLFDAGSETYTQLTTSTSGASGSPSIDDGGSKVAFVSNRNLTGDNPDFSQELFLHDTTGPTTTQITDNASGTVISPKISGDGTAIAFNASANVEGLNPDGNTELFLHDIAGADTIALTSTVAPAAVSNFSIDGDAGRVGYSSAADPVGDNPDGNLEIFLYRTGPADTLHLTDTAAPVSSGSPVLSPSGARVAFTSNGDFVGTNADGHSEIFRRRNNGTIAQLTDSPGTALFAQALDTDGIRTTFSTTADLVGDNPDGSQEVYLADRRAPISQVTDRASGTASVADIDGDGLGLTMSSTGDFTGENPDGGRDIFRLVCGSSTPTFTDVLGDNVFFDQVEWMVEAGVASGFPDQTFRPQDFVKRQQMANFLYNLAGQPAFTPPVTPTFDDYPTDSTYYLQVEWMADAEVASGFPDQTFRPQDFVKRQQMANFMHNFTRCCIVDV
jgi:Tol biopolymer transport system component